MYTFLSYHQRVFPMHISVHGVGYVGLVCAVCLAKLGHDVMGVDIEPSRVRRLNEGDCFLYEQDLPELLNIQLQVGRLRFTHSPAEAIPLSSLHFVATGTPSLPDGNADLSQVYSVVEHIARGAMMDGLVVIKSTVPVGTGAQLQRFLDDALMRFNNPVTLHVVSNPEFLREGTAIHDFLQADRVILGGPPDVLNLLRDVYQPLVDSGVPLLCMSRESAELTKYAANAMLASRISFMNQISQIAEKTGANVDDIRVGMGTDHRLGPHFLHAGIGYGGSCFPKDVRALMQTARQFCCDTALLAAIEDVNAAQKYWAVAQLKQHFHLNLRGKTVGLWGLAFKPGTDDMRDASSLTIMRALLEEGVHLCVYDPAALETAQVCFSGSESIAWCSSAHGVLESGLDALVLVTEWPEFVSYDLKVLRESLGDAALLDGRNCFALADVAQHHFSSYYSVGRPNIKENSYAN